MISIHQALIVAGIAIVGFAGQVVAENVVGPDFSNIFFGICRDNVAKVRVVSGDGDMPVVVVKLTPNGQKEFHDVTRKFLGFSLETVFDGVSLGRVKIKAPVESGIIVSRVWKSGKSAQAFADLLRDETIDAPCGLLGLDDYNVQRPDEHAP